MLYNLIWRRVFVKLKKALLEKSSDANQVAIKIFKLKKNHNLKWCSKDLLQRKQTRKEERAEGRNTLKNVEILRQHQSSYLLTCRMIKAKEANG